MSRWPVFVGMVSAIWSCTNNVDAAEGRRFEDYPAAVYKGTRPAVVLGTPETKKYRTRIRNAASGTINFAGHFILTHWDEEGCEKGAIINVRSGQSKLLPFSVCNWSSFKKPFDYQPDSRLLVVAGQIKGQDTIGLSYFDLQNSELHKIAEDVSAKKRNDGGFLASLFSGEAYEEIEPSAGPEADFNVTEKSLQSNQIIGPLLYCYDEGLKGRIERIMSESRAHSSDERVYVFRMLLAGGVEGIAREVKNKCETWYLAQSGIQADKSAIVKSYGELFGEYVYAEQRAFLNECVSKRDLPGWENLSSECKKSIDSTRF